MIRKAGNSILFDARLALSHPTGIGSYINALLPEVLNQASCLHIHLLRRPDPWSGYGIAKWEAPNLTQHVSSMPHMSLQQHIYLSDLARQLKVDVIHYPHFDAPVYWRPAPVIATMYDVKYLAHPEFFAAKSAVKNAYMRFSYAQTLKRAAAILAISDCTKSDLERLFRVLPERIHTTHLAAASTYRPASLEAQAQVRAKFALTRPFVLSVGERRPHKNHHGLIRAYARSKSRATHDLVIVGQAYRDYTVPESTVEELNLPGKVHFLDAVDNTELAALYSAAALFVLVSFYEGFGLPLLEAMACGAPVIASHTTATGEVTGDGGLQVNPADIAEIAAAVDKLLTDQNLRAAQIERGFAWQRQFSWQRTAAQTLAVYEKVLQANVKF